MVKCRRTCSVEHFSFSPTLPVFISATFSLLSCIFHASVSSRRLHFCTANIFYSDIFYSHHRTRPLAHPLSHAQANAPCLIFLDEIDSIAQSRESAQRQMESRIVAQLLTCMDQVNRTAPHNARIKSQSSCRTLIK